MKKPRILALGLVVAVMLMGAGYASWTSQNTINNTVSTGNFGVVFDKADCFTKVFDGDKAYIKPAMTIPSDNTMNVTVDNMYPGTEVCVNQEMKNVGTIPALFDNAVVTFDTSKDPNSALKNALYIPWLYGYVYDKDDNVVRTLVNMPGNLNDIQANINKLLKGVTLEPGQYIAFKANDKDGGELQQHFDIQLPIGTKGDNTTQNSQVKFSIQYNWKQVNETR